ncbi:MAG: PQQ-like domain [Verrucomicrobiota bacterium]|jgi:outer membrane protein assembly factor BamB
MKVQCACGAKYSFDATPEMVVNPISLVCQNCGTDISGFVNQLIQQELADATPAPAPVKARLSIHREEPKTETQTEAAPAEEEFPVCNKHAPTRTSERCFICRKPICPSCMELFGYACSPLCKAKASANGIELPVYENERAFVEARHWRKVGFAAAGVGAIVLALVGLWLWYIFAGCMPRPYFAVRFDQDPARSGESVFCADHQIVFLHGATLARHDTKNKNQIWSRELIAKPTGGGKEAMFEYQYAVESLRLRVSGQNVWVFSPGKLTRYDWASGEPKQEIPLTDGEAVAQGDEVLLVNATPGQRGVTHIALATGEIQHEQIADAAGAKSHKVSLATTKNSSHTRYGGLPMKPSDKNLATPLDPSLIASQVQSMSLPARIALPATLSSTYNQERLMNEINDQDGVPKAQPTANPLLREDYSLIPLKDGCLQFSVRLLEEKIISHSAMKAKSGKSALDGKVNQAATGAIVNELLNDMQRDRGGDTVTENVSRYWVTLRRADEKVSAEWVGEVTGPPGVIPLDTVNVLAAGEMLRVFDKANKKLWEAKLTFKLPLDRYAYADSSTTGAGPCVERGGVLYVADEGVLTAFDLATGAVRWRLPSVGIAGIFFDDAGMIYLNTTTADLDSIKFSRQIDVNKRVDDVVTKLDPRSGKLLWSAKPGGMLNYVSGQYLFVVVSQSGDFDEHGESTYGFDTGLEKSASLKIRRLNPKNGRIIWDHYQDRCPIDVKFRQNEIQLVFRREVQALKFLTF